MARLRGGQHYPRSVGEFQAWFGTDSDCLDYLEWVRWPAGFTCPSCGYAGAWRLGDGRYECVGCHCRTSVTAGTIFDRTRTPLTVWFTACWMFASGKHGVSALTVQRTLEIGSYQTAWAMLHRLRSALVRPGRGRLAGTVGVDETFIGGGGHGARGGGGARRAGGEVGGGGDVHWRGGARPARRAAARQEGPDRHRGRDRRAERHRPVPDGHAGGRVRRLARPVRGRQLRAGQPRHHRRLGRL